MMKIAGAYTSLFAQHCRVFEIPLHPRIGWSADWRDSVPCTQAHVVVTRNVLFQAPTSAFDIVPLGAYIELVPQSKKSHMST